MAVLNFPTRHFRIKFAALRVIWGQVKGREGSLGLVLGLVSSIEQYIRRNSILFVFFLAIFTVTEVGNGHFPPTIPPPGQFPLTIPFGHFPLPVSFSHFYERLEIKCSNIM